MKLYSLPRVDAVYQCGAASQQVVHIVQHDEFRQFCLQLRSFTQELADEASSEYWSPVLQGLCRFRFLGSAMPLPFSSPELSGQQTAAKLRDHLHGVERIFPHQAEQAQTLVHLLESLSSIDEAPLWNICRDVASAPGNHSLLLQRPPRTDYLGQRIDESFPQNELQWVTAPALRGLRCYDRVIAIGPLAWFPDYVLDAPRGKEIHVVRYAWIADPRKKSSTFIATDGPERSSERTHHEPAEAGSALDASDVMPRIEWSRLKGISADHDDDEVEQARLFLLEGGDAVFLEDDDGSETTVIDLDQDAALSVRRLPIREIERGMFVLLRTEGGGDYIPELADRLLGVKAAEIRDAQRMWKRQLRLAVRERGAATVLRELTEGGSARANEANLRTWTSNRSLRTQHYEDFLAIMNVLGLAARSQELWDKMGILRIAHQTAGQRVRKLLIARVQEAAADELQRRGRVDFELPGEDGGTLTAYRVVDISPEPTVVSSHRISHPFELDGSSWHG